MVDLAIGNQRSLQEQAYGRLRQAILSGALRPGTRLVETELSVQMGISRSPIREAVRRLEQEGLVIASPRRGARVAEASLEYEDLFDVREALEIVSARLAARRAAAGQLGQLREANDRMRRAIEAGNVAETVRADADFHRLLALSSGNAILDASLSSLLDRIQRARLVIHDRPENSREALGEHEALLEAVAARDERRAVAGMQAHMRAARRRLTAALARRPVNGRSLAPTPSG